MWTFRLVVLLFLLVPGERLPAQDTAFGYQGKLLRSGQPADGVFDFEFALFDTPSGGAPIALEQFFNDIEVRQGAFTVLLDFGSALRSTSDLYLEIRVRPASLGALTLLEPRQRITAAPRSVSTNFTQPDSVDSASIVNGSVAGGDIGANTIGSAQIGPNAIGASELASQSVDSSKVAQSSLRFEDTNINSIQRRVGGACAPGATIRAILNNGTVICEPDRGLRAIPTTTSFITGVSNGGISELPMEDRTSHLCVLSRILFQDVDGSSEAAVCSVFRDNVQWVLRAEAQPGNDADVSCSATCFTLNPP